MNDLTRLQNEYIEAVHDMGTDHEKIVGILTSKIEDLSDRLMIAQNMGRQILTGEVTDYSTEDFMKAFGMNNKEKTMDESMMVDWQKRVVAEKNQLDEKIAKLLVFINTNNEFVKLSKVEQNCMRRQEMLMELYSEVLAERISKFT